MVEDEELEMETSSDTEQISSLTWKGHPVREIEDFTSLKNQYEVSNGIILSYKGIVDFVDSFNSNECHSTWKTRLDIDGVQMATHDGGSKFSKTAPFVRVQAQFPEEFSLQNLISVIYEPEHVPQWDPQVVDATFKPMHEGDATIGLNWTKHKKTMHVQERDYCDKVISFVHKGKFYHYSSAVPEQHTTELFDTNEEKSTVRGNTIYNVCTIERDPVTQKLMYESFVQLDPKVQIPPFIINKFIPNMIKDWYKGINNHYQQHFQ